MVRLCPIYWKIPRHLIKTRIRLTADSHQFVIDSLIEDLLADREVIIRILVEDRLEFVGVVLAGGYTTEKNQELSLYLSTFAGTPAITALSGTS